MSKKILSIIIILVCSILVVNNLVFSAEKAVLYLDPDSSSFNVGETFIITVKVDTKGNTINSARGIVSFPYEEIEVVDLNRDSSIFLFWDNTTSFSNDSGEINFGGGLPSPGFSGSSGEIFSVAFRIKSAGTAIMEFKEASVLANDEDGTDVLGRLGTGTYELKPESTPIPLTETFPSKKLEAPQITTYPERVSSTEILYLEGYGVADSTIILYIEKVNAEPIVEEIDTASDGEWSYVHDKFLQPGEYSIYAKTKIKTGEISENSEPINVSIQSGSVGVFGFSIKNETLFGSIILILVISICVLFIIFVFLWQRNNGNKKKLVKEVNEASDSVVKGFGTLKEEVERELKILKKMEITKDVSSKKEKEERKKILDDLMQDLELLEKIEFYIKKEIKDIENILPS